MASSATPSGATLTRTLGILVGRICVIWTGDALFIRAQDGPMLANARAIVKGAVQIEVTDGVFSNKLEPSVSRG